MNTIMLKIIFSFFTFLLTFFSFSHSVFAQEKPQLFEAEPLAKLESKGRHLKTCLAGWRQFLIAGIGYQSFKDYFHDFFLWPSHYVDVANVQDQLNKSRYDVMAAFMKCDLDRLKSVTEAYYRLEAELYFVRHFVDTEGGFLRFLIEDAGNREKFLKDMSKYFLARKGSTNKQKDEAVLGGYFDLFETKYRERAKTYASASSDKLYEELAAKFEQLLNTFKTFNEFGNELAKFGSEAFVEPALAVKEVAVEAYQNPGKTLKKLGKDILGKFDACLDIGDNRECLFGEDRIKEGGIFEGSEIEKARQVISGIKKSSEKRSFEEVIIAVSKQELKRSEDLDKVEMLSKYEFLYGEVTGDGVPALLSRMDHLLLLLGFEDKGSLKPLSKIEQCASEVQKRQCGS